MIYYSFDTVNPTSASQSVRSKKRSGLSIEKNCFNDIILLLLYTAVNRHDLH